MKSEHVREIQPCGSYFELDNHGYVINPTSKEKIRPPWDTVVAEAVHLFCERYEDVLDGIYVRGSVTKGEAEKGISDVDFLVLTATSEVIDTAWRTICVTTLKTDFPFIAGVDIEWMQYETALKEREWQVKLLQSACVWGIDRTSEVPRMKPGKDMAIRGVCLASIQEWLRLWLNSPHDEEAVRRACVWLMKSLLRSGFELTMERSKKYTRSLFLCYEQFSIYYEDKATLMRQALFLALNPTGDVGELRRMMSELGDWMIPLIEAEIGPANTNFKIDFVENVVL